MKRKERFRQNMYTFVATILLLRGGWTESHVNCSVSKAIPVVLQYKNIKSL